MKHRTWTRREFGRLCAAASLAPRTARTQAGAGGGKLRAGAATVNITPPLGCSLAGGMTDRIATDVHDELHVRSLVLDDGESRIAIALVDSCVVPREIFDRAKQLIAQPAGIPRERVLLAATHTHSAPPAAHLFQSLPDSKYTEWLPVRIADAVRMAANRLRPARIGWGTGREERLVFNRRYFMKPGAIPADPWGRTTDQVLMNPPAGSPNIVKAAGPTDPEVGVLAVEGLDGRPICLLGNYALHYVGGTAPGHISADYFAAWAESIKRLAGAADAREFPPFVPILANGCSGNINGIDFYAPPPKLAPYEQMQKYADTLAAECRRVWQQIRFQGSVKLGGAIEEVELGVRSPTADDVAAAKKLLDGTPAGAQYKDRSQIYARETLIMSETFPQRVKTVVQALRIGPLAVAAFPGEAFVELGLQVKRESPFRPTLVIELANDYRGYIPTVEGHDLGGYETWRAKSSYLEKGAVPKLVATALRLLERINHG